MGPSIVNWDLQLFTSTFALIFLAELPDKTAIYTVMMATQKHAGAVFLGVAGAFVVQSLVAVVFGSMLSLLPASVIRIGTGLLFLGFALLMWFRCEKPESDTPGVSKKAKFWATATSSFMVIFLAEWGDLTQLAAAALQAKYHNPFTIFMASTLALWAVTGLAIVVGHHSKKHINPAVLQKVASFAFAGVGLFLLVRGPGG